MDAHFEDDVLSRNVISELVGSEHPDEVIVMGGHIDSWDVGQGAVDDGGGCVIAWEAVRLLHDLGLRPRRTVRVVLWTNEENGLRGGTAYRDSVVAAGQLENHVLAIESDGGVFAPVGFGVGASDEAYAMVEPITELLMPVLSESTVAETGVTRGGGGADIGPLMREGVPGMSFNTDAERYFWYHHTPADTVDKLDAHDIQRAVAAMAIMAFVVADMPERLPHSAPASGQ
jgi:carboxypeptidase Q